MRTFVVDTAALIALFNPSDQNNTQAELAFKSLEEEKARLIYPSTTLVETVDTLQRRFKDKDLANLVVELILGSEFTEESIEPVNGDVLKEAAKIFKENKLTRRSLADATVAAVAKKYKSDGIFSFDNGFEKLGFKLVEMQQEEIKGVLD